MSQVGQRVSRIKRNNSVPAGEGAGTEVTISFAAIHSINRKKMKQFDSIVSGVLIAALNCFLFNAPLAAQEIKVMTYNIYHGEQCYNRGSSNLEQVAEIINRHRPDFVAMQEVDSMTNRTAPLKGNGGVPQDIVKVLAEKTGMHGFFGKAIDYDNGGYGEGILSRHPVTGVNHNLPIPLGGEGRALAVVEHTLPGGLKILFAATHLCHQHEANRIAQVEAINEILNKTEQPVILGGDFNFQPDSPPYRLIGQTFLDAAAVAGNPQYTYSPEEPKIRIDYIFLSKRHKWTVKQVEVIPVNASDHMPLLVTLELKENGK